MTTQQILTDAKNAKGCILTPEQKNNALMAMADSLIDNTADILAANAIDMKNAAGKLSASMMDRLKLDSTRIEAMADGIRQVAALPDPVGRVLDRIERPNGIVIEKKSVPIGVIAIIYESRPNVTSDAAALCLKSGNVCVLRSGKDAFNSANAITQALRKGLEKAGLAPNMINLIQDTSRASSTELMTADGYVDLLIPRGGSGLINACVENATVPCIHTGTGICHIYIDEFADLKKAVSIVSNAKTSRPSVCNAMEVCLVHSSIAKDFLPMLHDELVTKRQAGGKTPVELRLDSEALQYIPGKAAAEDDFDTEFLDYILAVKTVGSVDEASAHISKHSTNHSEAIITENETNAEKFVSAVDSAAVYVNASTRFTDGGEFGLGCEMGISTQKLHARGPMGLCELNTYKYVIHGNGQIR